MSDTIILPGDHKVVLRDPMEVSRGEALEAQAQFIKMGRKGGDKLPDAEELDIEAIVETMERSAEIDDWLVAWPIVEWDLGKKPGHESFSELPVPTYNALKRAAWKVMREIVPGLPELPGD